jgi:RNA polymerase sigma factor (sigma-70 family)
MSANLETNGEAVEVLSRQYRPVLLRYFARRGMHSSDLEDLTQEVFARLIGRQGFADVERREAYLFETAANVAIDHHRRAAVRKSETHRLYDDQLDAFNELSPERISAAQQELDRLVLVLREMPERMRHVFVLTRLESVPQNEVAQQLRISQSTVEKNLVKAIAYLSARLERLP